MKDLAVWSGQDKRIICVDKLKWKDYVKIGKGISEQEKGDM